MYGIYIYMLTFGSYGLWFMYNKCNISRSIIKIHLSKIQWMSHGSQQGRQGCKSSWPQVCLLVRIANILLVLHGSNLIFFQSLMIIMIMRQWMDLMHRPEDDFCSVQGFILAVRDTMRVKRGGLLWAGHPCSGFLVFSTTKSQWRASETHKVSSLSLSP